MKFDESNTYQSEVRYMFSKMQEACNLVMNESCATHIHLSPSEGIWGTKELKRICKPVLYFEEAIEVLFPAARRRFKFCRSNRFNNPQFITEINGESVQARGMAECFRMIEKCRDVQSLAEIMGMRKFMAWNLVNVFYSGWSDDGGTIEFRRPPGVTNPDDCLAWMELAVCFVHAARELQDPGLCLDAQSVRDVAGLEQLRHDGLSHACGTPKPRYLQRLFHGKSGRIPPIIHADHLSHDLDNGLAEAQRGALERSISPGREQGRENLPLSQSSAERSGFLSVITGQARGGLLSPCVASPRSVVSFG